MGASTTEGRPSERMEGTVDLRLVPTTRAPAEARGAVADLAIELRPEEFQAVQLLVSELVTNSVRHARLSQGEWIDLSIRVHPEAVRVTVTDPGRGFDPPSGSPQSREQSGWGLFLVERLADRWGVASDGHTKVWFEVLRRRRPG